MSDSVSIVLPRPQAQLSRDLAQGALTRVEAQLKVLNAQRADLLGIVGAADSALKADDTEAPHGAD